MCVFDLQLTRIEQNTAGSRTALNTFHIVAIDWHNCHEGAIFHSLLCCQKA